MSLDKDACARINLNQLSYAVSVGGELHVAKLTSDQVGDVAFVRYVIDSLNHTGIILHNNDRFNLDRPSACFKKNGDHVNAGLPFDQIFMNSEAVQAIADLGVEKLAPLASRGAAALIHLR